MVFQFLYQYAVYVLTFDIIPLKQAEQIPNPFSLMSVYFVQDGVALINFGRI